MNRPPEPPPEGVLIETSRTGAGLSVREAARRAGISEGWWRQVVKGYQSLSGGGTGPVRNVPADTVAKMALAALVPPGRMETEGQRPDAAAVMRRQQDSRTAAGPPPARERELPVLADADEDGLLPYIEQVSADLDAARDKHGPLFGASQAFPDPNEATVWHDPDNFLTPKQRIRLIARMRRIVRELDERERRTGLAALPGRW